MIWYCQKFYSPYIFFFSLFSPSNVLPHLQTLLFDYCRTIYRPVRNIFVRRSTRRTLLACLTSNVHFKVHYCSTCQTVLLFFYILFFLSIFFFFFLCFLLHFYLSFLVADTQLYRRFCPSVGPLVHPTVRHAFVKLAKSIRK